MLFHGTASGVCAVELACRCRGRVRLQAAGAGYYCKRAVCMFRTWVLLLLLTLECGELWTLGAGVAAKGGCEMSGTVGVGP